MSGQKDKKIVITSADLAAASPGEKSRADERGTRASNVLLLLAVGAALGGLIYGAARVAAMERSAQPSAAADAGPASTCLIMDRSGSMAGRPLADAQEAAKDFVRCLKLGDDVAVVDFGTEVRTTLPLRRLADSSDTVPVILAIDSIVSSGSTALWDAGFEGVRWLSAVEPGRRRVMVMLTDGLNNASEHSVDELIAAAKQAQVVIHTVALGNEADRATLDRVAQASGGTQSVARTSRELRGIYRQLGKKLH